MPFPASGLLMTRVAALCDFRKMINNLSILTLAVLLTLFSMTGICVPAVVDEKAAYFSACAWCFSCGTAWQALRWYSRREILQACVPFDW